MAQAVAQLLLGVALLWPSGAGASPEGLPGQSCTGPAEIKLALGKLVRPTGAISTYFDPTKPLGNLIEPYFGNLFFWHLLAGPNPGPDVRYAAHRWIEWYMDHANSQIRAGDDALVRMDGVIMGLPTAYRPDPQDLSHAALPYSAPAQARVNERFRRLHVPGSIYRYYVNDLGQEIPGFAYFEPDLSVPAPDDPLLRSSLAQYVYDSTDSYGATFISLVRRYLEGLSDVEARQFFLKYHYRLKLILGSSFHTVDLSTHLSAAAPYTSAQYLLDNAEVWAGLRDYRWILLRAIPQLPEGARTPVDGTPIGEELAYFTTWMDQWNQALATRLASADARDRQDLAFRDGALGLVMRDFPVPDSLKVGLAARLLPPRDASGPEEGNDTYPNVWRLIPLVRLAGASAGSGIQNRATSICERNIGRQGRRYPYWNALESASYAHLLLMLSHAVADKN